MKNEAESEIQKGTASMLTRDEALERLAAVIDFCETKLQNGRVRDQPNERIRQGWATPTIAALKAYLAALRDGQLDEIEKRLAALETGKQ